MTGKSVIAEVEGSPEKPVVLVTGASGLIGGRLIEHLTARDDVAIRAASRVARNWPKTVDGRLVDYSLAATLSEACQGVDAVVNL
ncbi:MAG: NAD-dependent epimerase/dehydratase family protein, partial [Gemmatimonadaceae bacterium]|nr:NAD-dependent epimerase/dehydratase family protein [Gemmatimonadaceae bacterium]